MIDILPQTTEQLLVLKASGTLTDSDYKKVLIPKIDSMLNSGQKLRCVFEMGPDFHGWDIAAAWDDATFGVKHRNDFEKLAVVGGPKWVEWATKLGALLMSCEVKTFADNELEKALSWMNGEA